MTQDPRDPAPLVLALYVFGVVLLTLLVMVHK